MKKLLFISLCFLAMDVFAQNPVKNPSFEGRRGADFVPPAWQGCFPHSTPDTQPGPWQVNTPSSHGQAYMSMVCRGDVPFKGFTYEAAQQFLATPFRKGRKYKFSIDLARSSSFDIFYARGANLRIWGGYASCGKNELLFESGEVTNTDWKTYNFEFITEKDCQYIVMEAYYGSFPEYNGNILIDNLKYYPEKEPEVKDTTEKDIAIINDEEYKLPKQISDRPVEEQVSVTMKKSLLKITAYDNRTFDGDIISLYLNGKYILKEFEISKEKKTVVVELEKGDSYYLILYAHNLGRIPPNTAAIIIDDGVEERRITLESNLGKCAAAKITIE